MRPFKLAVFVLGTLALFFLGFLLVGILLPSGWEAERSARIDAAPESVFPLIAAAGRWTEWTPAPDSGVERFGPEAGVGSGYRWDDPGYGVGEFQVTHVTPEREVRYAVEVDGGAIHIVGWIRIEPAGDGEILLTWREEGDFGWNPLLGYLAGRMNELQGAQMESSLAALSRLAVRNPVTTVPD